MTDDFDQRLTARFAGQDDSTLQPTAAFALVRAQAARFEQHSRRRRRLTILIAVVVAALVALPAIALSRTIVDRWFGGPAQPGLREYIGRVLPTGPTTPFAIPPRYVAGTRTSQGLVLLWSARRADGTQCTGLQAAFGDADVVRIKLAGTKIADNGISCRVGPAPLGPTNAGLTNGQGLGSVHVEYGQAPSRVHTVRVTLEDGTSLSATPNHGWVILAFEHATRRAGHRPVLEQALDARGHPIASKRLNPWDYGGNEPPPPPLDGPGSSLLTTIPTSSGSAQLRLSAPGRGWERRQCWGVVIDNHSTPILCAYPAAFDPRLKSPSTNNLFLYGPHFPNFEIAIATRIDHAWLIANDHDVTPASIVRFTLAGTPQIAILAPTRRSGRAVTGIVTSRDHRVVGALLIPSRKGIPPDGTAAPCFLATPSAGAPPATPACRALIATARSSAQSAHR